MRPCSCSASPHYTYPMCMGEQIGPVRWEAPEVLNSPRGHKVFSFASDVFSFGVMLYEVVTRGQRPWGDDMSDLRVAGEVARGGSLVSRLPEVRRQRGRQPLHFAHALTLRWPCAGAGHTSGAAGLDDSMLEHDTNRAVRVP